MLYLPLSGQETLAQRAEQTSYSLEDTLPQAFQEIVDEVILDEQETEEWKLVVYKNTPLLIETEANPKLGFTLELMGQDTSCLLIQTLTYTSKRKHFAVFTPTTHEVVTLKLEGHRGIGAYKLHVRTFYKSVEEAKHFSEGSRKEFKLAQGHAKEFMVYLKGGLETSLELDWELYEDAPKGKYSFSIQAPNGNDLLTSETTETGHSFQTLEAGEHKIRIKALKGWGDFSLKVKQRKNKRKATEEKTPSD